jgi:hypothetical protein
VDAVRFIVPISLLLAGCVLATSPEEAEREALPKIGEDGDEFHRPGQPCLTCHRDDYNPGGDTFVVAGTIYRRATDLDGVEGAEVIMVDAAGREMTALTNRVGNFMVEVGGSGDAPRQRGDGRLRVPWNPEFPLQIRVRLGSLEQEMESFAWRDGSCGGCHQGTGDGAESVRKVFVEETP